MNARRNLGVMGFAVGLSASIAMMISSEPLHASARQDDKPQASMRPVIYTPLKHDVSPRLDSIEAIEPLALDLSRVPADRFRFSRSKMANQAPQIWQDPVAQLDHGFSPIPSPIVNFDGVAIVSDVVPSFTLGAVGPNHYVQAVDRAFAVYDKTGTKLYPAGPGFASSNTPWQGFGGECESSNDGNSIMLFDRQAGRWLMSRTAASGAFTQCIAISQTSDPTGAWYRYAFAPFGKKMNRDQHIGIWPDGYYMTTDQFVGTSTWAGAGVVAFERDKMLAGLVARAVYFDLSRMDRRLGGQLPSDVDGAMMPPPGTPNYILQFDDDGWGYESDQLETFKFHVDWATPADSTFTGPTTIDLTSLGYGFDAISDRLTSRLVYRNFGNHESLVFTHTVDVDGAGHAGIRWYELRAPGTKPTIHQAGTYAPDLDRRWTGRIAMDASGNMAIGYSVSSDAAYPSVRYAGRLAGDPLGTLPQAEATLVAGSGSQTESAGRLGDNGMMRIDPVDDCTFWYTQEYVETTGSANRQTRIGAFKFPSCTATPSAAGGAGSDTSSGAPAVRNPQLGRMAAVGISAPTGVTLAWDANTELDIAGYEVSYGTQPGVYSTVSDVGNVASTPITLTLDSVYYFVVKAYNSSSPPQYSPYSIEITYDATKATPVITWTSPASIVYGTALGATQLNATASVPGTFAYDPPAGTVLSVGAGQTLSVTFTPTDLTSYTTATGSVAINVTSAKPVITSLTANRTFPFVADGVTSIIWTTVATGGVPPLEYQFHGTVSPPGSTRLCRTGERATRSSGARRLPRPADISSASMCATQARPPLRRIAGRAGLISRPLHPASPRSRQITRSRSRPTG